MAKRKLLVYGAGAIGRGYMPWVFSVDDYDYYFVESDPGLRAALQQAGKYTTHKTTADGYSTQCVKVSACFSPGEERSMLSQVDAVVTAVGPRNFTGLRWTLKDVRIPVICCENDASLPEQMRRWSGNEQVVFAIPDVITSNTARTDLLAKDPLAIVTEDGVFVVDQAIQQHVTGACRYVDEAELQRQWLAKLYIHNTPHCIAAYLGNLRRVTYLHETMAHPGSRAIVEGAMHEMVSMLTVRSDVSREFLISYRDKELARFCNVLLCDPITRVAREPFRKLAPKDRLIGAAQLCLAAGVVPENILLGIMAAFCFESPGDPDAHISHLRRSLSPTEFLRTIFKFRDSEALFLLLMERWQDNLDRLEVIKHG